MKEFAEMLKINKTVTRLNFDHNRIEEVGAQALIDSGALEKEGNSTLQEFLVDVKLPKEMFTKLVRAGGGGKSET